MQGVETKGQIRYLGYVDQWLRAEQMYSPTPLRPPPDNIVTISKVKLCRLLAKGASKFGSALLIEFRNPSWQAGQGPLVAQVEVPIEEVHAQLTAPDGEQVVTIDLGKDVWVQGDFRIDVLATRWNVRKRKRCLRLGRQQEPAAPLPRSSTRLSGRSSVGPDERRSSLETSESSEPSETMILESNPQVLSNRVEAGKVAGLWVYAHVHTAFMGDGPLYALEGADLDVTKLQKKVPALRLSHSGRLEFEFSIEP